MEALLTPLVPITDFFSQKYYFAYGWLRPVYLFTTRFFDEITDLYDTGGKLSCHNIQLIRIRPWHSTPSLERPPQLLEYLWHFNPYPTRNVPISIISLNAMNSRQPRTARAKTLDFNALLLPPTTTTKSLPLCYIAWSNAFCAPAWSSFSQIHHYTLRQSSLCHSDYLLFFRNERSYVGSYLSDGITGS